MFLNLENARRRLRARRNALIPGEIPVDLPIPNAAIPDNNNPLGPAAELGDQAGEEAAPPSKRQRKC